jgi:HEPN domain-containing protein
MPKASIIFELPEEERDHLLCVNAEKLASACWDADQRCRTLLKYSENPSDDAVALAEDIREILREIIDLT